MVPEQCVRKVPVQVCRIVNEQCVRKVPVTTCKMVYEERVEQVPYQVCRMVAEQQTVRVPHCVEKRIPVTYTCYGAAVGMLPRAAGCVRRADRRAARAATDSAGNAHAGQAIQWCDREAVASAGCRRAAAAGHRRAGRPGNEDRSALESAGAAIGGRSVEEYVAGRTNRKGVHRAKGKVTEGGGRVARRGGRR